MASLADLLRSQNFGKNDSAILSTINHPITAARRGLNAFRNNVNTVAGLTEQYDNPNPLAGYTPEQQSEAALNLAGLMQTGAMPFAPASNGGVLGTFVGKMAKHAPLDKYNEAEQLITEKYPHFNKVPVGSVAWHNINKDIHAQTGIHYSPEGMPRHEISDNEAVLYLNGPKYGTQEYTDLADTLLHNSVYQQYPELKKMNVSYKQPFNPEGEGGGGYGVYINPYTDETERYLQLNTQQHPRNKETILHEMQHAIQDIEGFERGGNSKEIWDVPDLYLNNKQIENIKKLKDYQAIPEFNYDQKRSFLQEKAKDILGNSYNAYKRLAGEAEARATTKRMNMTPEQRASSYPYDSYDFPVSELLVRSLLRK